MAGLSRNKAIVRWGLITLSAGTLTTGLLLRINRAVQADQTPPPTVKDIKLGEAHPGTLYALTVAVKDPAKLQGSDAILATVKDSQGVVDTKWLHTADLDLYLTVRPRSAGPMSVSLSSTGNVPEITTALHKVLTTPDLPAPAVIAAAPNDTWQTAQPFDFGQTIYGSDDERPYA